MVSRDAQVSIRYVANLGAIYDEKLLWEEVDRQLLISYAADIDVGL